ncbi:hypothetical protein ACIBK9_04280 [Nonomuraea sp. NPDC050227]|uniref:hypothetical protein n=1 Tax=Nonomuraea sp. NPDC050227 TaxID=3364360 RepID=UPI00378F0490
MAAYTFLSSGLPDLLGSTSQNAASLITGSGVRAINVLLAFGDLLLFGFYASAQRVGDSLVRVAGGERFRPVGLASDVAAPQEALRLPRKTKASPGGAT